MCFYILLNSSNNIIGHCISKQFSLSFAFKNYLYVKITKANVTYLEKKYFDKKLLPETQRDRMTSSNHTRHHFRHNTRVISNRTFHSLNPTYMYSVLFN